MTKTLTEQWREGKLPENTYYVQFICGRYGIYEFEQFKGFGFDNDLAYIKEVLAPVPDYQTWKDFQQHFVDKLELEVKLKKAYEQLEQESINVVGLQEQLKEANKLILWCARISWTGDQREDIFDKYLAKWGVK